MAPIPPEKSFRITALCIRRLCLGYRNKNLVPPPTSRPDILSASIVIASAFVAVCLMLMLLLLLLESIRIMTITRAGASPNKSAQNMAHVYNKIIGSCPPTFPDEPATCSICLEDYRTTTIGRKMPCGHFFHVACIDRWVLQSASKRWPKDVVRCPICKQPVLSEHVEIPIEQTPLMATQEPNYSESSLFTEIMV